MLPTSFFSQTIMSTIDNAVTFLRDPNVQSAAQDKKLAFLQAKGLSSSEIDEALRLAALSSYTPAIPRRGYQNTYAQQQQARDWRDWFIMTIVGGSVAWLATSLARVSLFIMALFTIFIVAMLLRNTCYLHCSRLRKRNCSKLKMH